MRTGRAYAWAEALLLAAGGGVPGLSSWGVSLGSWMLERTDGGDPRPARWW